MLHNNPHFSFCFDYGKEVIDYILVCNKKGMNISGIKDSKLEYIQIIENDHKE